MKRRLMAIGACLVMLAGTVGFFAGCSKDDALVVWTFTNEIETMVYDYMGKDKKDVKVEVTPIASLITKLDRALSTGQKMPDVIAMEEKYLRKYVDSNKLLSLDSMLGADTADMYPYTLELAKNADGNVMGFAWQATPGALYYRASMAEQYLDITTPEQMAERVSTWSGVLDVAAELKAKGDIKIFSAIAAPAKVFYSQRESGWVVDGKLNIEPELYEGESSLYEIMRTLQIGSGTVQNNNPFINESTEWDTKWTNDMSGNEVFSYFLSSWGLHYNLKLNAKSANSDNDSTGDWRIVKGPAAYSDGGTWLCVLKDSKKQDAAKELIKHLTTNKEFLRSWAENTGDFMNNKTLMNQIQEGHSEAFLGGQNHYAILCEIAEEISGNNITSYDSALNSMFNEWAIKYAKDETTAFGALEGFKDGVRSYTTKIIVE